MATQEQDDGTEKNRIVAKDNGVSDALDNDYDPITEDAGDIEDFEGLEDAPEDDGDIEEVDHYPQRLAAINEVNPVVANENIYNTSGALLLAEGSQFSSKRAEVIAKHKLVKPLEHSVDLSSSLSGDELFEQLMKYASTLPGLHKTQEDEEAQKLLQRYCKYFEKYPLIRQKLAVLSSQLPEIYSNSLYSAVAGVLLGIELKLEDKQLRSIFIGALMHNTGFLHLNPELTRNESELEQDETLRVQVHPIIAKQFLDNVPGLPKIVGEAVNDHHERTDGTGYPKHKFGEELSIESQVIGFTDIMVSAYRTCLVYEEYAPELMLTILLFNTNAHFESVFKAANAIIKCETDPEMELSEQPDVNEVIKQQERIDAVFDVTKKLGFVLMKNTRSRLTKSIASMLGRLATSIISAGITQAEYHSWLEEQRGKHSSEDELLLLKSKIMQDEIEDQLERFKSIMWKAIKNIPREEEALIKSVMSSYEHIDKTRDRLQ